MELFEIPLGSSQDNATQELLQEYLSERKIILNEDVSDYLIELVALNIIKWNKEDTANGVEKDKRKPIYIFINSTGGDAFVAQHICDLIEQSVTPVYTVAMSLAASAAFVIYVCGHKRYAYPNSILLMHDGSINLSNSTDKVKQTMTFLDQMEERSRARILKHTEMTEDFYDSNFNKEFYMYADTVGKDLGCVDYIIGVDTECGKEF